ncbi:SpoIIE family protein phosphatase [Actinacidiphila bryophytorum]|uniref:protein-serine/threonine phosphatase n=1 Tax=Actinacidiphila bryophytorum TaxID=1436133 RepID=A0A9W4MIE4_9ACTN|nr:SpoIIE family protein phosphatase [Actinacidiphila bryophytorum]MBM9435690.1 SpoIIE family protein phosphatase [Actinacidiphila bryophytorum]MBN6545256.1 SpoIIE family protein phosphatase [Actinacidiphila bryophytorum]CAG7650698.1 PAS domain S-box-containing protein [Actinacidiphila bryophytorum]
MHDDPPADIPAWVWQALLNGTTAGVAVLDTDLRYVYVNPALALMNGLDADAHVGRTIEEIVPLVDAGEETLRQVLADGRTRELVSSGQTRADSPHRLRVWRGSYHRLEDEQGRVRGLGAVILEVSADREIQAELERTRERLQLLDAAAVRIGRTLEVDRTGQELCDLLVEVIADVASVEVLATKGSAGRRPPQDGMVRLRRAALAAVPGLREAVQQFGMPGEHIDYQPGSAIPRCLETGHPMTYNVPADATLRRSAPNADRVDAYRAAGIHSALVVPLAARGAQLGTVTLVRAGSSPAFDEEDVSVAVALADRAAISMDNARRYSREHGIAVELQRALLAAPGTPHPQIDVATRYLPAGATDLVGGDWFDTLALPSGITLLAMGDVMGHGVEAAVEMSHYRSMLRVVAGEGDPPDRILRRMDALLAAAGTERPATCMLALADPVRGGCWFANAGHLPPAVVTPDGRVRLLDVPTGPPLGADLRGQYEAVYVRWPPGDTLLLYTDGLVERRTEDIDTSLGRLAGMELPHAAGPLDALLARVVHRLAPSVVEDDVALLAARARPRFEAGL